MSAEPSAPRTAELDQLADRLARLEHTVGSLADRLEALEAQAPAAAAAIVARDAEAAPAAGLAAEPRAATAPPAAEGDDGLRGVPALLGRTCLVLGGAFLVRSLTDSGTLTAAVGVALGVAYAVVWLALADRAAAKGRVVSGAFHALASALIVYPLLLEATIRFALLDPWTAAALLAAATGAGLAVAWRRSFHAVAWITMIAAVSVAAALLFRTRTPLPFVLDLLLLAAASLALAYGRGWRGQRWLVALAADAVVLLLGVLWLVPKAPTSWLAAGPVLVAQVGLVTIYLGAFVLRLLVQARSLTPFAVFQTVVVLLVGFEGALLVAEPAMRTALAVVALAVAALLHGQLARRTERRFGHGFAVGYFSTVATFFAAEGVRQLLPPTLVALIWLVAAVTLGALALGGDRPILQVHAAVLALAGALLSGLLPGSLAALTRPAVAVWRSLDPTALVVLALVATTAALLYGRVPRGGRAEIAARAARLAALAVALVGLGGWIVHWAAGVLASAPGPAANAGAVAALRSAVLAAAAIALAAGALALRRGELLGFAWFVVVVAGLKLAVEDLRVAGAGHLVFSLVLYGAALIAVPALARRLHREPAEAAAGVRE